MLSISNLTSIMDKQFNGKEISPADLESKLRAVNSALEIYNDSNLSIRFSFGEPIDDEKSLDDWKEIECLELKKIPADRQNMKSSTR